MASANPATGGPVEGLKQLNAVISSQGHEVEVVSLDDPESDWIKTFPLKLHALGPGKGSYQYCADLIPWLESNKDRFDNVIVNGIWQYNSYAVWKVLRTSSVPYFVFTHGMLDPWFNKTYPLKHLKKLLYWPWGMYGVLRDAKAVLFTSEDEKLLARQSFWPYKVNEVVVKYGTPGPSGDLEPMKQLFLSKFPELVGKRVMLYLSRIHEKKGCDLLVRSFGKFAQKDDNLRLVMAGPDKTNMVPQLQALASEIGVADKILWPGMLQGEMKWGAYSASEVFVLPSHQENFGIVVAEALACETPVLISNKINIWREIESDGGGCVEDDTQDGTDKNLERWLNFSEKERGEMSRNARVCFEQNFEIKAAAESLLGTLRKLGRAGKDV